MKKRILPLLTALCLMVGVLTVPAGAEGLLTLSVGEEELLTLPDREEDELTETETETEMEPETEVEPEPNPLKVRVNEQRVFIDNDDVPYGFYMCALIDEEGNATNYIRVRDLATALLDTPAQFGVTWDGQVTLTRGGESDSGSTGEASGVLPMPTTMWPSRRPQR